MSAAASVARQTTTFFKATKSNGYLPMSCCHTVKCPRRSDCTPASDHVSRLRRALSNTAAS